MMVTITLDDQLAVRLQAQAVLQHLSVEALTLQLLAQAVAHEEDATWQALNQRRIALMQRQYTATLSPEEASELAQLQERADQHLAPLDQRVLDHVTQLHRQVQRLIDSPQR